ncbi:MAG: hypothetical protein K0Q79_1659 [Flavipsychrobacter sp.]|jgi:hypothetical protein|nr:hypothetical protein [Flavipsychrobacter sp.]
MSLAKYKQKAHEGCAKQYMKIAQGLYYVEQYQL